ncbi:sugar diacid recognition domain-containing protein [Streptomyces sp. NPDC045714]|uniref:GntT/GntP/DsdX family permease n=1 Tax=Streptomyces sp. NPDC045714 TaxID=3154913 RepID=UPI00340B6B70
MMDDVAAQAIVGDIVDRLGVRVNVMDGHGVIIAGSDRSRVGSLHEGAPRVPRTGRLFSVTSEEAHALTGTLAGVHLPLRLGDEIVGVVGVSGDPTTVGEIAGAIARMAELMERTGAAVTLAEAVLKVVGTRHPALAMSVMGWFVSIPVFCDSGYVVLSPLQRSIARRTGKNPVVLGTAPATGRYASHTFVPPTPGPIAAAGNVGIGSDGLVWVILFSIPVSLVAALAGLLRALRRTQDLEFAARRRGVLRGVQGAVRAAAGARPGAGSDPRPDRPDGHRLGRGLPLG